MAKGKKKKTAAVVVPSVRELVLPALGEVMEARLRITCCGFTEAQWAEHNAALSASVLDPETAPAQRTADYLALVEARKLDMAGLKIAADSLVASQGVKEERAGLTVEEQADGLNELLRALEPPATVPLVEQKPPRRRAAGMGE